MKGGMVVVALMAMLTATQLLLLVEQAEAFNCEQAVSYMSPCITYLTNGGSPTGHCCNGVRNLSKLAASDRRGACECLKAAARSEASIKEDLAAKLPGACGVNAGGIISKNVDCTKVS